MDTRTLNRRKQLFGDVDAWDTPYHWVLWGLPARGGSGHFLGYGCKWTAGMWYDQGLTVWGPFDTLAASTAYLRGGSCRTDSQATLT